MTLAAAQYDTPAALAVEYNGECMGGLIESGALLIMEPGEPVRPLDVVSVLLNGFDGPWARFVNALSMEGYAGLVKIFLGIYEANGERVCLFGQLNPPTLVPIPESAIAQMFKLDVHGECGLADAQALLLLAPFAGMGLPLEKEII